MKFNIIVAMCNNNGIGINNTLPWNIPGDLKRFSKLTTGSGNNAIIMGKNTWLSLPKKPLPKRDNLILSTTLTNDNITTNNTHIFNNINKCISFCENKYDTIWVIGGHQIYNAFIKQNLIDELYITHIDAEFECDTFFPEIYDGYLKVKNDKIWCKKYNTNYYYQLYKKIKINEYYFYNNLKNNTKKVCRIVSINTTKKKYIYTIEIGSNKYNVYNENLVDYC